MKRGVMLEGEEIFWEKVHRGVIEPWYVVEKGSKRDAAALWKQMKYPNPLIIFARRNDNDDMACLEMIEGRVGDIVLIHGWTNEGFAVMGRFETVEDWLELVAEDAKDA